MTQSAWKLLIKIESDQMDPSGRKDDIQINPWTLINMNQEVGAAWTSASAVEEEVVEEEPDLRSAMGTGSDPLMPKARHTGLCLFASFRSHPMYCLLVG